MTTSSGVGQEQIMSTPRPYQAAVRCDDVEQAQSFLSREYSPLNVTTQNPSSFGIEVVGAFCGNVSFTSVLSRADVRFDLGERFDGYSVSLPLGGALSLDRGSRERVLSRPRGGLIMDSQTVESIGLLSRGELQWIALGSDEVHDHVTLLTQRPVNRRVAFEPHFSMEQGVADAMFKITRCIIDGVRGHAPLLAAPSAMASLKEAVLSMFVEAMPHDHSKHLNRPVAAPAPRHVRRAIDFMHANVLQPLQLSDIVRESQVSARSLQMGFRQFGNVTPMGYLRRLRLEGAHDELLRCARGTQVAEIAYRWGFAHHGMFAKRYADMFGESPSATLRRQRKN